MKDVLAIAKAMSDPNRLRVLCALRGRELCACDIIAMLGLAQATVSRHMSLLVQAGLVIGRKDGRWTHYRLPDGKDRADPAVVGALGWVHAHAGKSEEVKKDEKSVACNCGKGGCWPER